MLSKFTIHKGQSGHTDTTYLPGFKNTILGIKDDCLLGCCAVQSGRSLPTFQGCLVPQSSGRSPWLWRQQAPRRRENIKSDLSRALSTVWGICDIHKCVTVWGIFGIRQWTTSNIVFQKKIQLFPQTFGQSHEPGMTHVAEEKLLDFFSSPYIIIISCYGTQDNMYISYCVVKYDEPQVTSYFALLPLKITWNSFDRSSLCVCILATSDKCFVI
jgi:hypothetical protein